MLGIDADADLGDQVAALPEDGAMRHRGELRPLERAQHDVAREGDALHVLTHVVVARDGGEAVGAVLGIELEQMSEHGAAPARVEDHEEFARGSLVALCHGLLYQFAREQMINTADDSTKVSFQSDTLDR
jgi:hypothetical protein